MLGTVFVSPSIPDMLIKRILLLFWALFFSLVCVTDLFDGLKALRLLPQDWVFASENFGFMVEVTGIYGTPTWLVGIMFTGVIAWAGAAAFSFWRAFRGFTAWTDGSRAPTESAFALGIGFWAALLVADELYLAYLTTDVSGVHARLLIAQIASLLVVALVPGRKS